MKPSETNSHPNANKQPVLDQYIEDIIRPIKKAPKIRSDHDISLIQEKTKHIPFFEKYIQENKGDVHLKCCKHMTYEKFNHGDFVFQQGERGSKFYIILDGKVGIFIRNKAELKKVKELQGGDSFGELALVNDAPRSASIKCLLDCHFAVLDKKNYITLFQQILDDEIKKEISFYPEIELFSSWNYNKIKSFYTHSFRIKVKKGEKVITQDETIDAIYIIVNGEFVVKKNNCVHKETDNKSTLHQLRRLSFNPALQQQTKAPLFIMGRYEIFGQEGVETDGRQFQFTVECHSFEGNLIYIKIGDYMKIIWKDEAQREYMRNYSTLRLQRVQDRINEIQQVVALKEKKDAEQDKPIEATPSQQAAFQIFGDNHADEQVPPSRKGNHKKTLKIDVLTANPNQISSNDNPANISNNNSNNNADKNGNTTLNTTVNHLNMTTTYTNINQSQNATTISNNMILFGNNDDQIHPSSHHGIRRLLTTQFGFSEDSDSQKLISPESKQLLHAQSSIKQHDNTTSSNQMKLLPGFFRNARNSTSLSMIPLEIQKDSFESKDKSSPQLPQGQFCQSPICYTPVSLRQQLLQAQQFQQLPFGKALSDGISSGSLNSPITHQSSSNNDQQQPSQINEQTIITKPQKRQIHVSQSKLVLEESRDSYNLSDNEDNDLDSSLAHHHHHHINHLQDPSHGQLNQTQKQNRKSLPQDLQNHSNLQIPNSHFNNHLSLRNHLTPINTNSNNNSHSLTYQQQAAACSMDEMLHPLVKGFHEQLKLRFYSKFKNGQIEDLKAHMGESPIQSLQPSRKELELGKPPQPQVFVTKKNKDQRIKELRDYEQKLRQLIRSDGNNNATIDSISPFQSRIHRHFSQKNVTEPVTFNSNNNHNHNNKLNDIVMSPLSPVEESRIQAEDLKETAKQPIKQSQSQSYFFQVKDNLRIRTPGANQVHTISSDMITLDSPSRNVVSSQGNTKKSWNKSSISLQSESAYSPELRQERIPMKRASSQAHQRLLSLENIKHVNVSNFPSKSTSQTSFPQKIGSSSMNNFNFDQHPMQQQQQLQNYNRSSIQLQPYFQSNKEQMQQSQSQNLSNGLHVYNFLNHSHTVFALSKKNFKNRPSHIQLISASVEQEKNPQAAQFPSVTLLDYKQTSSSSGNLFFQNHLSQNASYKRNSQSQQLNISCPTIKTKDKSGISPKQSKQQFSPTTPTTDINQNMFSKTTTSSRSGFRPSKGFNLSQFQMNKEKLLKPS